MATSIDWRSSLTASERYENIQRIQQALVNSGLSQTAFAVESEAYNSSQSREEYNKACSLSPQAPAQTTRTFSPPPSRPDHASPPSSPGIRIGPYQDCHYLADGATSTVYRSSALALKVIHSSPEPHNPQREAAILSLLADSRSSSSSTRIIPLLDTFRDQESRFVLVFPYMPLTLADLLDRGPLPAQQIRSIFTDIFSALSHIHAQGIIHRDIKPSAILLSSPTGPAYLSDFGTAWHPTLSSSVEPSDKKILDIGTGPYRAPEVLFGDGAYTTAVDMWAAGAMVAECVTGRSLFESRPTSEDGNQLGLILSVFKVRGSPTPETWPEGDRLKVRPWGMYRVFEGRWEEVLEGMGEWNGLVAGLVRYSGRLGAEEALKMLETMG